MMSSEGTELSFSGIRYSCVLGNSLLKRIERSDAEVRLLDQLIGLRLMDGT